jgi:L-malate glycosyltransferase
VNSGGSAAKPQTIVVVWQALVAPAYRSFFVHLQRKLDANLWLIAPKYSRELGGQQVSAANGDGGTENIHFIALRAYFIHAQIVLYRGLRSLIRRVANDNGTAPVIINMAEPYSVTSLWVWWSSFLESRSAVKKRFICFGLQNIHKHFALPIRLIQKLMYLKSDAILACGKDQEAILRAHGYGGPVCNFPLWYDESIFCQQPRAELSNQIHKRIATQAKDERAPEVWIGFCGSLLAEKGLADLFSACHRLTRTNPKTSIGLIVVGDGPLRTFVEHQCRDLSRVGIPSHYLGTLNNGDLCEFYNFISILVVPSRSAHHWKEQFGRVIIEAQACGTLVIGSDSGEIPNVVSDQDWLFPEGNSDILCEKLQTASEFKKSQNFAAWQKKSIATNERFSSRATAEKFADWLSASTARHHQP